ncbi:MAG: hypothetical protein ACRDLF_01325 [Solirubrobacteraceae bacterium]
MSKLISALSGIARVTACVGAVVAVLALIPASALAGGPFCTGNRAANSSCEGTKEYVIGDSNQSTNGGWSWVWVWNEGHGGFARECRSGNCYTFAELEGYNWGKEQMANISGKTYWYEPQWW